MANVAPRRKKTSSKERRRWILTPIDEAVVVLLVRLVAVPFLLEYDRGHAFGTTI
jgi:hypothetical protein